MNTITINTKLVRNHAILPTCGTPYAAGYDLYACSIDEDDALLIEPGQTKMIGTGVAMEIHDGMVGLVFARSGLSIKQGLRPANCVGVIDSDYRGEIIVSLRNESDQTRIINYGDRIAQIVFTPFFDVSFCPVDELSKTVRGTGGHGSTGR